MTSANITSCCKRMGTPLLPPQKPPLLQLLLLPPPPLGSRPRSQLWAKSWGRGWVGDRKLYRMAREGRLVGGRGLPHLAVSSPLGPCPSFPPPTPQVCIPRSCTAAPSGPGSLSCQNGGSPSPSLALLVGEGGAWLTSPASAYSFNSVCS